MSKIMDEIEVKMNANYGDLVKNSFYTVLEEGFDYYLIKHMGRHIYVPKSLIISEAHYSNFLPRNRELPEYEEFI